MLAAVVLDREIETARSAPRRLKFTARGVLALRPPATGRFDVWDADLPGFGLRLRASGLVTWVVRYRKSHRQRVLTLGNLPPLSLAAARALARKTLAEVELGNDPAATKQEERDAPTFGRLTEEYLDKHAPRKRTGEGDRSMIERELLPHWKHTDAKDVRRADVIAVLDDIAEGRGPRRVPGRPAPIRANRVLALARKIFNFGIQRGLVCSNPCHLVPRPGVEHRRERVLSEDEIRGLWLALDGLKLMEAEPDEAEPAAIAGAVRMMLLTAQRRGEVLRLRWVDISEESSGWWWTIPGEYAKNGLAHRVPLSTRAIEVLKKMQAPKRALWVFPGRLRDHHVENVELSMDRARARFALAHFTPHDLRRTAASLMTGLGIPRLVVKKVLNHADRDVTAIYDRHSYEAEKRHALEAWGLRVAAIVGTEGRHDADGSALARL